MDDVVLRRTERIGFDGLAAKYFGIWIVNILLTIVTLGIYSPWAKVRRLRYFYGSTFLDGHNFEYHGRPLQILIGRVIAIAIILVYNVLINLTPLVSGLAFLALLLLLPLLVARGLRFNARVTSYRNVRFDFAGGYGGALLAFVIGPMLALITLGIFAPQASRWHYRYLFNNLRYGGRGFACDARVGTLYRVWLLPALVAVAMIVLLAGASGFARGYTGLGFDISQAGLVALIYLSMFILLVAFSVAGLLYSAGVRNVVFRATTFDGRHRLFSDIGRLRYTWIAISNVVVTLLTLGLMRPWAAIRMARYTWAHTALEIEGDFGKFFSEMEDETGVVGAEFMDIEGFDIGF